MQTPYTGIAGEDHGNRNNEPAQDRLLRPKEVAYILGVSVSRVCRMANSGG